MIYILSIGLILLILLSYPLLVCSKDSTGEVATSMAKQKVEDTDEEEEEEPESEQEEIDEK